jgi:hypothetical protein
VIELPVWWHGEFADQVDTNFPLDRPNKCRDVPAIPIDKWVAIFDLSFVGSSTSKNFDGQRLEAVSF